MHVKLARIESDDEDFEASGAFDDMLEDDRITVQCNYSPSSLVPIEVPGQSLEDDDFVVRLCLLSNLVK